MPQLLTPLTHTKLYTTKELAQLDGLGVGNIYELLTYFPIRYSEQAKYLQIKDTKPKQTVMLIGIVKRLESSQEKYGYKKVGVSYTRFWVDDGTGSVSVVFWNMPFIKNSLQEGQKVCVTGQMEETEKGLNLNNPKLIKDKKLLESVFSKVELSHSLFEADIAKEPLNPIYKEIKTIKQATIKKLIFRLVNSPIFQNLEGVVPAQIETDLHLPSFKNALLMYHSPKNIEVAEVAKKYFAFQEIFLIQTYRAREKFFKKDCLAYELSSDPKQEKILSKLLPFQLTGGQQKVTEQIYEDLSKKHPMSRLVEGDVGSGKTALALLAALKCVTTTVKLGKLDKRLQTALMAPTEVLASQHFETFCKLLQDFCLQENLHIGLLAKNTGKLFPSKTNPKEATQFPKNKIKQYLEEGKIDILIGTHSVIQKRVRFSRLGLLIIDEQHRFGIKQRMNLIERAHNKNLDAESGEEIKIPHLLSLSATPIPRTLALTIYGDLDLSILDELPPGRKRAVTHISPPSKREQMYREMEYHLSRGKQAYIICSKVEENEEENLSDDLSEGQVKKLKNVKDEYKVISKKFSDYKVGLLYGSQPKLEKEKVLEQFYKNEIQILVATSVVEVGVSVANATCIIIENSERFGLSQLHQLRGRVERSTEHSDCFLCTSQEDGEIVKRLDALAKSSNGFELAEVDLAERGAGALIGKRQSGLTDIGMEAIKNRKLVEIAKSEAEKLIAKDPTLSQHRTLTSFLDTLEFHGE